MRINKFYIFILLAFFAACGGLWLKSKQNKSSDEIVREVVPVTGSIRTYISCTGSVLPKNRLEVKPPVNGRVESVLVKEGDKVKAGQVLALMSSTERAALLDAARGKGEETLKYWEQTYKPIPLPAPIDAEVIVQTTQPGRTVTTAEAVVVLSDRLIVRAQVDETDIGKISDNLKAEITLDAYPDNKIKARVEHIYHESKTVNNVTVYEVDLAPEEIPLFFRSGMNASVDFIYRSSENALLIPAEAVRPEQNGAYVLVRQANNGDEAVKVKITQGISDDKNVEVLSGLSVNDRVILKSKKYRLPKYNNGGSPFSTGRR